MVPPLSWGGVGGPSRKVGHMLDASLAVQRVNQLLQEHRKDGGLTESEAVIIQGCVEGWTYPKMAEVANLKPNTIHRHLAPALYRELSAVLRIRVTKRNLRHILEGLPKPPTSIAAPSVPFPHTLPFYGRERELNELSQLLHDGYRIIGLHGMNGIGKKSLALALQERVSPALQLATMWRTCTSSLVNDFAKLFNILKATPTLLVLAEVDILERETPQKLKELFLRLLEETPTLVVCTSTPQLEVLDKFHPLKVITYPVVGLELKDAFHIFREFGIEEEPMDWQEIHASVGGSPFLIRQLASWAKSRLGGRLSAYRQTIQFGVIKDWFKAIFADSDYLGNPERELLQELDSKLMHATEGVAITEFIGGDADRVSILDKLIEMGLIQLDPTARLSLNAMLSRYLRQQK